MSDNKLNYKIPPGVIAQLLILTPTVMINRLALPVLVEVVLVQQSNLVERTLSVPVHVHLVLPFVVLRVVVELPVETSLVILAVKPGSMQTVDLLPLHLLDMVRAARVPAVVFPVSAA